MRRLNNTTFRIRSILITGLILFFWSSAFALIGPVKRNELNEPALTNCSQIKLVKQNIELYHHPLGIWLVTCTSLLKNQAPRVIDQEVACTSGFDIGMTGTDMYCDEFKNFRVFIDGLEITSIKFLEQCPNYVDRIGMEWTNNDNTRIGFVNTWPIHFEADEEKTITVSFSFIVKLPSVDFQPEIKDSWYIEQMDWLKQEYSKRDENDFKLPLCMGSLWALYVDTLSIQTYISDNWLIVEPYERQKADRKHNTLFTYSEPLGFYSPSDVQLNVLTDQDVKDMSTTEIQLLRNSFFAKYGRPFENNLLKLYFKKQPWYWERSNYDNFYLTDWDVENIKFLHDQEEKMKE
ncbi:YARHG domain-containing protein [candidate division KSB1 bacterium]|nr:YARHG domain-containing protein [candidate division KSB1 bacterium]